MAKKKHDENQPTIIKKYANRRLYDTGRSSYVTLNDLYELVKEGHDFIVIDTKNGDDITRSILTHIIVEQESGNNESLLPTNFLKNLITLYGEHMQETLPNYLDQALQIFTNNQDSLREQMEQPFKEMNNIENTFSTAPPLDEIQKKNTEIFENTIRMFASFQNKTASKEHGPSPETDRKELKIKELKDSITAMEEELNQLS